MCQLSLCRGQSLLFFVRDCSLQRWHLSTWWEALALKAGSNLKEGKLHGYYTIHDLCWASPRGTAVTLKEGNLSQHGSLVGQLAPFHPCASLGLWIAGGAAHFSSTISTVYLGIQSLGVALCCIPYLGFMSFPAYGCQSKEKHGMKCLKGCGKTLFKKMISCWARWLAFFLFHFLNWSWWELNS